MHHLHAQLNCAAAYMDKPDVYSRIVLWSDETKTELFANNEEKYILKSQGDVLKPKNTVAAVVAGDCGVMLWYCCITQSRWNEENGV